LSGLKSGLTDKGRGGDDEPLKLQEFFILRRSAPAAGIPGSTKATA
jgi:hypothetical protein